MLSGSDAQKCVQIYESHWSEMFDLTLIIEKPPDLTNASQVHQYQSMITEFETLPNSYGADRHLNWLTTYRSWWHERKWVINDCHWRQPDLNLSKSTWLKRALNSIKH